MPDEHLRDDNDVEAILRLAVQNQPLDGANLRERLEKSAAELGISPDVLAKAESDYASQKVAEVAAQEKVKRDALEQKERVRNFWFEMLPFAVGALAIAAFFLFSANTHMWWLGFPIFIWGIRLSKRGRRAYYGRNNNSQDNDQWNRLNHFGSQPGYNHDSSNDHIQTRD